MAGETVRVGGTVRNSGQYAGDEVVQLYLKDEEGTIRRPLHELKRFRRISLEPG